LAYIFQNYKFIKAINVYSIIFIFLYCFIAIGEDGIYGEWGTKLNYQALSHFAHFGEVIKTISTFLLLAFFIGSAIAGGLFTWLYWKKVRLGELYSELKYPFVRYLLGIAVLLLNSLVVFTGIRGGWYPIPISQSVAYYSSNPVLNDAAVNPGWNLISNISENSINLDKSPFIAMPSTEAHRIVDELYEVKQDTNTEILMNLRPNICIIILESWSADMIKGCGGLEGITPNFDSLARHGILFDNMIASAGVSDQGIVAVLSGHPHTNRLYFGRQPQKAKKISSLSREFHAQGYNTGFYFGGQLSYGNIKSYLFDQSFDIIKEESDYDSNLPRARLGIHDGVMLQQYAMSLSMAKAPFLYSLFTLSSHMPYDIPVVHKFDDIKEETKYASSMYYSDASLGEFFKTIHTMPWYKNTLFVLVADHSHNSPIPHILQSSDQNHIPCLFFGDVIKKQYRGSKISRRVMQADIASTILKQCKMNNSNFPWSRNLFNPYTQEWAFYPINSGGGFADAKDWVAFDTYRNSFYLSSAVDSVKVKDMRKKGEAIQQVLFDEFLNY
jgi:phosphoglycerol transferase MdoB-like AlkP superfamily enzyme